MVTERSACRCRTPPCSMHRAWRYQHQRLRCHTVGTGYTTMAETPIPNQINLVVKDMEATVAFYRRLGLTIPDTDAEFQNHHRNAHTPGGMGVLGFQVASRDRVDEVYADLTGAGYRGQQEPYDAFWGARYAVVEDPDGNAVGIMSPVDPQRRSDPGFP